MTGWEIYFASIRFALMCGVWGVAVWYWETMRTVERVFAIFLLFFFAVGTASAMTGVGH